MKIVYLAYWGVNDGLTVSVINPHLQLLMKYENLEKIYFVTIERGEDRKARFLDFDKNQIIKHLPLISKNHKINLLNKTNDFILFPKLLGEILDLNKINLLFTHGMVSGSLAYLTCVKRKIPYIVFAEPHSQFMLESGVWRKSDPRYLFQKKWEKKQIQTAETLYSVTKNYYKFLKKYHQLTDNRIGLGPNAVNLNEFSFNLNKRNEIRSKLNIPNDSVVGIYVGKFGGIYLESEAFDIFEECQRHFNSKFKTIILSPQDPEEIMSLCKLDIVKSNYIIRKVEHHEVNEYLSAADFGFSMQNPKESNKYLCPLKNGEYWANGLPILIIDGVGDDTEIIKMEGGGAVFNLENNQSLTQAIIQISQIIDKVENRSNNVPRSLAEKYRNINLISEIFDEHIGEKS